MTNAARLSEINIALHTKLVKGRMCKNFNRRSNSRNMMKINRLPNERPVHEGCGMSNLFASAKKKSAVGACAIVAVHHL